jgi:uncharacterized protein DUF5678
MATTSVNDGEIRMAEDFEWARHASEVQQNPQHFGKLVAVYNRHVVAVGRQRQNLIAEAAATAQAPAEQIVVVLVPRPALTETPR